MNNTTDLNDKLYNLIGVFNGKREIIFAGVPQAYAMTRYLQRKEQAVIAGAKVTVGKDFETGLPYCIITNPYGKDTYAYEVRYAVTE